MTARLPKKVVILLVFTLLYILMHYTWMLVWKDSFIQTAGVMVMYVLVDIIVVVSLFVTFRNSMERTRLFWIILAIACLNNMMGNIVSLYEFISFEGRIPLITTSDYFYISFLLFYLLAFAYKVIYNYDKWQRWSILCDIAIVLTITVTLTYDLIFINSFIYEGISIADYIKLAYFTGDLLLVFISLFLFVRPAVFVTNVVLRLLASSLALYACAHIVYSYTAVFHPDSSLQWIYVCYEVALLVLAIAGAWNEKVVRTEADIREARKKSAPSFVYLPYAGAVVLSAATIMDHERILVFGLIITFCLVLLQQGLISRQNRRLLHQLKEFNKDLESRIEERTIDLQLQKQAISQEKRKFESLYENHPDPIFTLNIHGFISNVNRAGIHLLGYEASDLLRRQPSSFIHEEDFPIVKDAFQVLIGGEPVALETRAYDKNKDIYYLTVTGVPIVIHTEVIGAYITVKDITEFKKNQQQIHYLAFHDTLTGLPNRRFFMTALEEAILHAQDHNERFAVIFIDLDRFKIINDTLGHHAGDIVLMEVAQRLRACLPASAQLARLAGDEFTVLIRSFPSTEDVRQLAQSILTAMQEPIIMEEQSIRVTPSIGAALYPEAGMTAVAILQNADMAMYDSKSNGRNSFHFYSETVGQPVQRKMKLEKDLAQALQNGELFVLYQPQVDVPLKRIIGVEALVRWSHPELGVISPAEFIPIAEESGLIVPIGEWVLREACMESKRWKELGYSLKVGVNISTKEFLQPNFTDTIACILDETDCEPPFLDLELTEHIAMENEEATLQKLKHLKELGIRISIDDFGTGYSSLAYLSMYPIDTLKIAREFIKKVEEAEESRAIVLAILSMAEALGISVIAEGVETKGQLAFLTAHKCGQIQGYYFSKPLEAEACTLFFKHFAATYYEQAH